MAEYGTHAVEPGQYPATAWAKFGLPVQDEASGAPGGPSYSDKVDTTDGGSHTNEPGQYPDRMPFAGTTLGGTGAPGSQGIVGGAATQGPDVVHFEKDTPYKSEFIDDNQGQGSVSHTTHAAVTGPQDWTQANTAGYKAPPSMQMPGIAQVTLDAGGDGAYQPGSGQVRRGGFMRGQR